jgi:hypothetical protein
MIIIQGCITTCPEDEVYYILHNVNILKVHVKW